MGDGADLWSWGKFFTGFISGKNYAKALVLGFCMVVILVVGTSVWQVFGSRLLKKPPTQSVGSNQGIIATQNEDKSGNQYALFNLFNWK